MLAEAIIRIGRPIKNSNEFPLRERIRLLTDVSSENCKNFFQNVFIVELDEEKIAMRHVQMGLFEKSGKKETFIVDPERSVALPIFYPNGGNPLHAHGIYPLPCYLMYDPHIKDMVKKDKFASTVLLPRFKSTIGYRELPEKDLENLAVKVANILAEGVPNVSEDARQLGILVIHDERLPLFRKLPAKADDETLLWLAESKHSEGRNLFLDGQETLKRIAQAKFLEAAELGLAEKKVSTFSNRKEDEVVSIYNKSWLWLSPTWEMPRSIYWGTKDWTKGIKVDAESYESFYYGAQFLKKLQVPIFGGILKEMFAPITSAEAKKHMKASSFEAIYGIPMVLPLLEGDSRQLFQKYRRMLQKTEPMSDSDLHLELLAGLKESIVPESSDEHRLAIIYYSGDLSRGNMHIRAVIEDVIPSVASRIQFILRRLNSTERRKIQYVFGIDDQRLYRIENLPSLLGNAFGPGYLWESLQSALHSEPLRITRLQAATAHKLNEMANREAYWEMKQELVFYYAFVYFLKQYRERILNQKGGLKELAEWESFVERYHQGSLTTNDLAEVDSLGFAIGLLMKQYSNSYFQKTKQDFVKHRVMKFGSRLSPEMIWKNGLLRCEELAQQWNMGLAINFRKNLPQVLLALLAAQQNNLLVAKKDEFLTAFWSGYLIYKKPDGDNTDEGDENNESQE